MKSLRVFIDVRDAVKSIEYMEKVILLSKEAQRAVIFLNIDLRNCNAVKSFCIRLWEIHKKMLKEDTCICVYSMIFRSEQLGCGLRKRIKKVASHIYVPDVPGEEKKIRKLMEWFEKKHIHFMVFTEEKNMDNVHSRYQILLKFRLPLLADVILGDEKTQSFFEEWSMDAQGMEISCFSDLISSGILGYAQYDCVHKSCLGNTLAISAQGDVSFCHKQTEASKLIHISQANTFMDFFENEAFGEIIEKSILKRTECERVCEDFRYCMGGCPLLESENQCSDFLYREMRSAVEERMRDWMYAKDYAKINPAIKKIFLHAAASGKLKK